MSAYDVEILLGAVMASGSILWALFELPSRIVRRFER